MTSLVKLSAASMLLTAFASQCLSQEAPAPLVPYPDGTGLVERRIQPDGRRAAMGAAPLALVGMGLSRAAPRGAEVVQLDGKLEFQLGPGTALLVNQPYGLKSGRSVSAKVISLFPVLSREVPLSKGSDVVTIVASDGAVLFSRYRGIPTTIDAYQPEITQQLATEIARRDFIAIARTDDVISGEPRREILVNSDLQGRLAWRLIVSKKDFGAPVAIEYWISALNRQILRRENALYAMEGTVTADVWTRSSFHRQVTEPRGLQRLELTGGGAPVLSDGQGRFSLPGTGAVTITGKLSGPTTVIEPKAGSRLIAKGTGTPSAPVAIHFAATTEFALAQTSAYYWLNVGRDFAASILDPTEPRLAELRVEVNEKDSCKAFWYPEARPSAIFYRAGGACPNTAYPDIVLHEMGHGIDQMNLEVVDYPYSEGFGDAISVLNTRQSCVGREFRGQGTCLRDASELVRWPLPAGSPDHQKGRVYAGFVWDLQRTLAQSMQQHEADTVTKQLVMSVAKMNPSTVPMAVEYTFIADDDDSNLSTCSRHQREISAAAIPRGLPGHAPCTPKEPS